MIEQQTISRDELITALGNGATLITGNSRLARSLLGEYEQVMLERGLLAWQTPDVLPVKTWLFRVWEEVSLAGKLSTPSQLLTPDQCLHLWETIVNQHPHALLRVQATARNAHQARQLMLNWQLRRHDSDFSLNEDTSAFAEWSDHFERQCAKNNWITEGDIPEQLIELIRKKYWLPVNELIWVGFDEFMPVLACLINELSNSGVSIRYVKTRETSGKAVRVAVSDTRTEVDSISRWVRSRLEKNPQSRIGIVVPDLAAVRTMLADALARVLAPDSLLPGNEDNPQIWNFSIGQPLSSYAVIRLAFQLLGLAGNESSVEELSSIFRSPYIAGATDELDMHSILDARLRKQGEPFISLATLHFLANLRTGFGHPANQSEQTEHGSVSALSGRIADLNKLYKTCPKQASANEWAVWFGKWLKTAGWAQGRALSSDEYQTVEAWKKILIDFGALDTIAGTFTFLSALARLKNMATARIFQPQSIDVPVQVLGLYEAIGLEFDHLWVMGLHDDEWPPSPRPDPFIPKALQTRHNMPHANQARELMVANTITERLSRSAHEVVYSYPQQNADEQLRPSPLIMRFPEQQEQDLDFWQGSGWCDLVRESSQLEQIGLDMAPPMLQQQASGGSAIFKHQSLCPFRAFAEHRLGARPLDRVHLGLNAMQRGKLLHKVLELFWQQMKNQKQLLVTTQERLEEIVSEKVEVAIELYKSKQPQLFRSQFRSVETSRLFDIIIQWLDIEKRRSPFTVRAFEKEVNTIVNGVGVHLWIDRIDELDDGGKVIIDYKTGKVSPGDWFDERPGDPQLPLYSVVEGGDIAAVLFGQLRAGELAYKGVVQDSEIISGLPSKNKQLKDATQQWPAVLDLWKQEIERLASGFRDGDASVNPKDDTKTCQSSYCQLAALCHINELQRMNDDEQEVGYE